VYELNFNKFYVNWKLVSFIFKLILAISERGFDVLVMKLVRLLLVIWGCEIHLWEYIGLS